MFLTGIIVGARDDLAAGIGLDLGGSARRFRSRTCMATTSPARAPLVNISRRIASSRLSRRSGPRHAFTMARSWSSVSGSTTGLSSLGDLSPSSGSAALLAFLGEPAGEPAHGQVPGYGSGGFSAGGQQPVDELPSWRRSRTAGLSLAAHQAR